jgi:hypothetical protein
MSEVSWEEVEDGEYNEVKATVNGHTLTVFSDRDGDEWDYYIDENDFVGPFSSKEIAQSRAIADAKIYF